MHFSDISGLDKPEKKTENGDDEQEESRKSSGGDRPGSESDSKPDITMSDTRKRKRSNSDSDSAACSSDSDSDDDGEKQNNQSTDAEKSATLDGEPAQETDGANEMEAVPTSPSKDVDEKGGEDNEDDSMKDDKDNADKKDQGNANGEKGEEDGHVADESSTMEIVDLDKVKEDVGAIDSSAADCPLHKTSSIFLRNLAPTITKAEVEAMCKRFDGYLRVAIADPLAERRWFRRGWVTFKRNVNIKEICWNLNNIRVSRAIGFVLDIHHRLNYISKTFATRRTTSVELHKFRK